MSEIVVQIDGLSKSYRLGVIGAKRLVDDVSRHWARLRGKPDPLSKVTHTESNEGGIKSLSEELWALRDVSLEVKRGEILGIIGRNGAGKSTLLKVLSRVTAPTTGEVRVKGRIASLLEVGTGFHPELTGRENVYLNGAILGMTKAEIKKRFDEIVDFSGIEKFIDTPVKRYSSGMYVRLAFSVAAHLEPEIMIVDEVLAVGDAAFRAKCLGKMQSVNREDGRTVLFVSHDMASVEALCRRGVVMEAGHLAFDGDVSEAVNRYLRPLDLQTEANELEDRRRTGIGGAKVLSIRFEDDEGNPRTHFRMGEPLNILVKARFDSPLENPIFGVNLVTDRGVMVADCRSSHYGFMPGSICGEVEYRMRMPKLSLYPRTYIAEPWVCEREGTPDLDWVHEAAAFAVTANPDYLGGATVNSGHGIAHLPTEWAARILPD